MSAPTPMYSPLAMANFGTLLRFKVWTLNHLLEFPVIFKNRMFNIRFSTKQDFAFYGLHAEPVILILVEC